MGTFLMEAVRFDWAGRGRQFLGLRRKRSFCSRKATGHGGRCTLNNINVHTVDQADYCPFLIFYCIVPDSEHDTHCLITNTGSIHELVNALHVRIVVFDIDVTFQQTRRLGKPLKAVSAHLVQEPRISLGLKPLPNVRPSGHQHEATVIILHAVPENSIDARSLLFNLLSR